MSQTLPPTLPSKASGASTPKTSAHTQDLSVAKLQQEKEREEAKVSMGQLTREKTYGKGKGPTTSVSRTGEESEAATSVAHAGQAKRSIHDEDATDEVRDRLRWQHIRKLMREKRAAAEAGGKAKPSKYAVPGMATGSTFGRKGPSWDSMERRLYRTMRQQRQALKNLSAKDRKYFLDTIEKHAKKVRAGTGFGRRVRIKMKRKIEKDRRKGVISYEDSKDMKRMIDQLPH